MHTDNRRTVVSVVGTVLMVVTTVTLASWFPGKPPAPAPGQAAVVNLTHGR